MVKPKKVFSVFMVITAALIGFGLWRLTSLRPVPADEPRPEATATLQTDTFQMDLPASWLQRSFLASLEWPEDRITFREMVFACPRQADRAYERMEPKPGAGETLVVADTINRLNRRVDQVLGQTASLLSHFERQADGRVRVYQRLAVKYATGLVLFTQKSGPDLAEEGVAQGLFDQYADRLRSAFLNRVKAFLPAYTWLGPLAAEARPTGWKTRYGAVARPPRPGYQYTLAEAEFFDERTMETFRLRTERPQAGETPAPSVSAQLRFSLQALRERYTLARTGFRPLTLAGLPGYEFQIWSQRLGGSYRPQYGVVWSQDLPDPKGFHLGFSLTAGSAGRDPDPSATLGRWRNLVETVRAAAE